MSTTPSPKGRGFHGVIVMNRNVVSFVNYKVKKDYIDPTLKLLESLKAIVYELGLAGYHQVVIDSLDSFVNAPNNPWIPILTHKAHTTDTGLLDIRYGSVFLPDDTDFIVRFIHLEENTTNQTKLNTLKSVLENIPVKYKEMSSGYLALVIPVIQSAMKGSISVTDIKLEGDYDMLNIDFRCDTDLVRMSINNLKMLELNNIIAEYKSTTPT